MFKIQNNLMERIFALTELENNLLKYNLFMESYNTDFELVALLSIK